MIKRLTVIILTAIATLWGAQLSAQNTRTLNGSVFDSEGQPLVGAGVAETGTKNGTLTDIDGKFSIRIPDGKNVALKFMSLGMLEKDVIVTPSQDYIRITMEPDTELEAAVINAGYGLVQKKENLTGSAFQVSHDDLAVKPAARLDNLLAGMVPGMSIQENTTNGRPSVKIRIRGDGSLSASCEPLWVVDGVPIYTGNKSGSVAGVYNNVSPLSYLNPDDIESMTVLKDASTTALYGADGANGVILVTTRNAQIGKTRYNASVKYGLSSIDRSTTIKYCNAAQWMQLAREGWVNYGKSLDIFPYQDNEYNTYSTTDTDWYDIYMGTGHTTQINFSAAGGTQQMENYFSLGYYGSDSPYKGNTQDRYSIRNKTTIRFTDNFQMQANLGASYNHNDIYSLYSTYDEILPIFTPYNEDGSYRLYNYYSTSDTEYSITAKKFYANRLPEREYSENYQNTINVDANFLLTYEPVKGLKLTSQTGVTFNNIYQARYDSIYTLSGMSDTGNNGSSGRYGVFDTVLDENLRANYSKTFGDGRHSVSAMAGLQLTDKKHPYLQATGYGFINDHIREVSYADASTLKGASSTSHTRSMSYIAHASYTFDRRYTVTLSERRQGYSSFSEYSRWGNFASIGLNWNIHREPFFHSNLIHLLSAKISYGNNGNSRIDSSSSYGSYSLSTGNYYGGVAGANQASPANPGLSWENSYILNTGVNVGLWKKVELNLEYYHKRTTDVLYSGRVSSVITDGSVMRNVGEITNQGIEFNLESTNIQTRDFTWSTSINGAKNWNIITKLYKDAHTGFFDSIWVAGASKDAWWLVRWAGVDPTNGAPMWYDADGNLTYTFSYSDRVLLPQYSKEPSLYGGVSNDFRYKDFALRVMFDYTIGGWDYCYYLDYGSDVIHENQPVEMLKHWKNPGDVSEHPRYAYKHGTSAGYNSTKCLYRMTSVQLRTLSLSYNLPKNFSKKIGVSSSTVSIIGDNLYLWTPAQSSKHNSYKTLKYSDGMARTLSGQISFNF